MKVILLSLLIFVLLGCSKDDEFTTINGNIMGTYYVVKLKGDHDKDVMGLEIKSRLDELNKVFSTYDNESELSKINQSDKTEFTLSDGLKVVLEKSLEISSETNGNFDVTVGPVVNAWGFGPLGIRKKPQKFQVDELLKNVGYQKLDLSGNKLERPLGIYIDLSSIAKGYAVDEIVVFLKEKKVQAALVEIGGEVRTFGKKADKESWKIGIEQPVVTKSEVQRIIPLNDMSIATSGSYRNYREYGDKIFSHTIDPKTGYPVDHKLISVSVLSKECMVADGWATALMVLGPEKGLEMANEKDIVAYFMVKEGEKVFTRSSDGFKKYLKSLELLGEL